MPLKAMVFKTLSTVSKSKLSYVTSLTASLQVVDDLFAYVLWSCLRHAGDANFTS